MGESDLRAALEELASLLRSVGADPWAEWASRSADRVAAGGDPTAIRRAFGGMGSLNDLVIHPINGHLVASSEVAEANERLSLLRQRIFAAATRAE